MKREELLRIAKPILFNTQMVRAILEGRKTCTRRLVKFRGNRNPNWTGYIKDGLTLYNGTNEPCNKPASFKVGDILYIRETWYKGLNRILYKANYTEDEKFYTNGKEILIKWKPSIHMPKKAARIFLRVTGVRAERLQDITMEQVFNEGIKSHIVLQGQLGIEYKDVDGDKKITQDGLELAMCDFAILWNSTIDKKEQEVYGWDANPWVWVYEFERIEAE